MLVIINGSPNTENGNCAYIAEKAAEIAKENNREYKIINATEILRSMKFPFCTACSTPCKMVCGIGTKLETAQQDIRESTALLMISPVYFGSVSAELKAFWDLLRGLRREKALYNKPGAGASVGASIFGGQETTIRTMHDMMLVQGMTIVGDGFGDNMGHYGAAMLRPAAQDGEGNKCLERTVLRLLELSKI